MAKYTTRTYEGRKKIQSMWEDGATVKEIAEAMDAPLSTIYAELRRGRTEKRLPDRRPYYSADLAQRRLQEAIERRGNRGSRRPAEPV